MIFLVIVSLKEHEIFVIFKKLSSEAGDLDLTSDLQKKQIIVKLHKSSKNKMQRAIMKEWLQLKGVLKKDKRKR